MATRFSLLRPGTRTILLSVRPQSTAAGAEPSVDKEWSQAKPYSEIPGPKPIRLFGQFGNIWRLMPFGTYGGLPLNEMTTKLVNDYGPIAALKGIGRTDIVIITDPADAELVFRTEGQWPIRNGIDSIDIYRRNMRKDIYNGNPGLGSSQGKQWQENRSAVNQHMMRPRNMAQYQQPIEVATEDFIKRIRLLRDENLEMPEDFANELAKWSLESVGLIALDTRLGCLDEQLKPDSDAQVMINCVNVMFRQLYNLDFKPSLYKYVSTRNWREFVKALDTMTDISLKYINKKKEEIASRLPGEEPGNSILENLLRSKDGEKMAVIMVMDSLAAGIDTTSHTLANALYFMAKSPEAQEKAFSELKALMPNKDDPLPDNIDTRIPYLKACIKESQRLASITGGNSRDAGRDIVLKGYRIPKGTQIVINNHYMSKREEHFPQPEEFIPERWLEGKESPMSAKLAHPFVVMPFGFGPRMCVGRRIAELELRTGLAKILRNFQVEFHYKMAYKQETLVSPSVPLKFRMEDRLD